MSDSVVPKPKKQFTDLPESEQREIILGAVKDSNEEQRKIMDSVLPTSQPETQLQDIKEHIYRMLLRRVYDKKADPLVVLDECFERIADVLGLALVTTQSKDEQ